VIIEIGDGPLPAPTSTEDITLTVFAVLFIGGLIACRLAVSALYVLALFYFKD
jgi:hypothetical protein